MEVELIDNFGTIRKAEISRVSLNDLIKVSQWRFDWQMLYSSSSIGVLDAFNGVILYKIKTDKIEGLIKIEFLDNDFFEMKNIEVAPSNFGSQGTFKNVAQVLISYACLLAFELNKGPYQGYLSFISKGSLINYYQDEYNAELVYRERMIINPLEGKKLIKKHLNIEL